MSLFIILTGENGDGDGDGDGEEYEEINLLLKGQEWYKGKHGIFPPPHVTFPRFTMNLNCFQKQGL